MGRTQDRLRLMQQVDGAFGQTNIGATADRLKPLVALDADVFELLGSLGFLAHVTDKDVATYRRDLPIPALHKRILTEAFQAALLSKVPLKFEIISNGTSEAVQVTATDQLIKVELTRAD
jgi:hypothetical protein